MPNHKDAPLPPPLNSPKQQSGQDSTPTKNDRDEWRVFRWFPWIKFLKTQYFGCSLMRYDEYATEKFKSLVMDYYTLTPYSRNKEPRSNIQLNDGPDSPPENQSTTQNTITDKMLEGYRNTAMRIVGKYVENDEAVRTSNATPKYKSNCYPTIQEVIMLEKCIIRFLPPVEMYMRGITIEHKYSEFIGNELFEKIKSGFNATRDNTDESIITRRTEIDFMLQSISDSYSAAMHRDQYRFRIWAISLTTLISLYGLICLFHLLWWSFEYWSKCDVPGYWQSLTWLLVPFMGSLGAFISVQYRNEKLPIRGDVMRTALELNSGLLGVCFRICIGAVFAILLNLLFVANLMNDITPTTLEIPKGNFGPTRAFQFMFEMQRLSSIHIAKVLCWSLVAGFAEQLIPDQLSRITKKLQSEDIEIAGRRVDATVPKLLEQQVQLRNPDDDSNSSDDNPTGKTVETGKKDKPDQIGEKDKMNEKSKTDETGEKNKPDQIGEKDKMNEKSKTDETGEMDEKGKTNETNSGETQKNPQV